MKPLYAITALILFVAFLVVAPAFLETADGLAHGGVGVTGLDLGHVVSAAVGGAQTSEPMPLPWLVGCFQAFLSLFFGVMVGRRGGE